MVSDARTGLLRTLQTTQPNVFAVHQKMSATVFASLEVAPAQLPLRETCARALFATRVSPPAGLTMDSAEDQKMLTNVSIPPLILRAVRIQTRS